MIIQDNLSKSTNKHFYSNTSIIVSRLPIIQFGAAVGNTNNDQLTNCRICRSNGWPHESITFDKVNGQALSGGGNEVKVRIVIDYFTGNIHRHRSRLNVKGVV